MGSGRTQVIDLIQVRHGGGADPNLSGFSARHSCKLIEMIQVRRGTQPRSGQLAGRVCQEVWNPRSAGQPPALWISKISNPPPPGPPARAAHVLCTTVHESVFQYCRLLSWLMWQV